MKNYPVSIFDKSRSQKIRVNKRYLTEKEIRTCKEICRINGIEPTKQNIIAAYNSF